MKLSYKIKYDCKLKFSNIKIIISWSHILNFIFFELCGKRIANQKVLTNEWFKGLYGFKIRSHIQ